MTKDQKIIVTVLVGALVVGGLVYAQPGDTTPTKPKTTASTTTSTASKSKNMDYTDADTKVHFEQLPSSKNNAFLPAVAKKTIGGKGGAGIMPNSVPPAYAGGDGGWLYTGTVIVDNSPSALMENSGKGEALYLRAGEKWLTCIVQRITPTSVTIVGPGGRAKQLELLADPPGGNKMPTSTSVASNNQGALPAANQPMMQAFDPSQITINGMDPSQMPAVTYQGTGVGGRRNRGGGGFGGGGRGRGRGNAGGGAAAPAAPVAPAPSGFLPSSDDDTTVTLPNTPGEE